jgi:O-glycosyl hydrolase
MRFRHLGVALLITCLLSGMSLAADVTINTAVRHQTIEGWGTSMIGWDLGNTPYYNTAWRNAYRDLGLNMLRVPMTKSVLVDPSGDYTVPVSLGSDLQTNVNKTSFSGGDVQAWGSMAQWLASNALEPERVKIVGSSWSPPHWMKGPTGTSQSWVGDPGANQYPTPWLSGQHNPWGANYNGGDSIGGRLMTEVPGMTQQFGRYMATWVEGWEQNFGVPLQAISLQNESTFENPFDSMSMITGPYNAGTGTYPTDWAQYARSLKGVKDAWQEFGLTTKIKGPHVASIGPTPQNPWSLNQQMEMIRAVKNYSGDPNLIDFLDYYNANYYMGTSEDAVKATAGYYHGTASVPANWGQDWGVSMSYEGVEQDGKPIWYSETGGDMAPWKNGANGTPGNGAITVAQKMYNALVYSDASAYIYWQMSDTNAQETEHTLLGKDHINDPLASKKYAAFKHFSRFIRPGAVRVDALFDANGEASIGGASEWDTYNSLSVSAFIHDEDQTATIVLLNMMASDQLVDIAVPLSGSITSYQQYLTDGTSSFEQLGDLTVSGGQVYLTVPGYSVVTLYGVAVPEPGSLGLAGAAMLLLVRRPRR